MATEIYIYFLCSKEFMKKAPKNEYSQFLRYIREFINETIGEKGILVLENIGDGATDELIEEKTKLKLAEIRSILNHLHSYGFVEYTREKNLINGWFKYTWREDIGKAKQNFLLYKKREYEKLRRFMKSAEETVFYKCRKGCAKLKFEDAFESKFKCPSCRHDLKYTNSVEELKKIEYEIGQLQRLILTAQT